MDVVVKIINKSTDFYPIGQLFLGFLNNCHPK